MKKLGILACCAALGGCASSTGVLQAGPDTYTITESFAPVRGGTNEAQRVALGRANDFCAEKGRQFATLNMGPSQVNGYAVTFKCFLPGDPALAGYQLQRAPNVVVEQRTNR